jgi:hypothetical protein
MPLASKWHNIGVLLGLPPGKLDAIQQDYRSSDDSLREMLKEWLKMIDPPPSWEQLVDALKVIDECKAEELRRKYCANS